MKQLLIFMLACGLFGLSSCFKPKCQHGKRSGFAWGGDCACEAGYEVDDKGLCKIESRTKYLGVYDVSDNCGIFVTNYSITITASSSNATDVVISNLFNCSTSTKIGTPETSNSLQFHIANQAVCGSPNLTFNASGNLNDVGTLSLSITNYGNGNYINNCELTAIKRQ